MKINIKKKTETNIEDWNYFPCLITFLDTKNEIQNIVVAEDENKENYLTYYANFNPWCYIKPYQLEDIVLDFGVQEILDIQKVDISLTVEVIQ